MGNNDTKLSLKEYKKEFQSKGIYLTNTDLASKIKNLTNEYNVKEVYDPTCGIGSLLKVFGDGVMKYGQEINDEYLKVANKELRNFTYYQGNTLEDDGFKGKKFQCIVANPPFSIKWSQKLDERFIDAPCLAPKNKADYAFILHILHHLKDDGIAVCLCFPGILYRGNSEGKIRNYLIEKNYIHEIIAIPQNQFEDTNIATVIIVFKKNRCHNYINFTNEKGESKKISIKEISDNDYSLSVNQYLETEEEPLIIDEYNTEVLAREQMLSKIRSSIEFSISISKISNNLPPVRDYLQDIGELINLYKTNL